MRAPSGWSIFRYLLVPAILAAGGGVWYMDAVRDRPVPEDLVRTVRVTQPVGTDLEDRFAVRAFIETDETVTVFPLVSGTLEQVYVDAGDEVQTDQVMARIDPTRYELSLAQAEASFFAAESTYQRTQRLFEAEATTVQNVDHARAQYEAARSQRDLAQLQLSYTSVRSPMEGVVLVRHLAGGDVASPERPLVTVGDISRLVVRAAVPEERYRRFISAPDTIVTRIETTGQVYQGHIRTVAPYVASETRTFEVVCDVDGDTAFLRPGMSVSVVFVLGTIEDVPTVPLDALGYGNTLWYVEDGRAWSMNAPDLFSDGRRLQVSPADAERSFIVAGHHFLNDGQQVKVIGASE